MENAPPAVNKDTALALVMVACHDTYSSMILFCQLNYPEELGTGTGYSIAHFGCAEVSVTNLLANVFGKQTDPLTLNQELIRVGGYASNGAGAVDLLVWSALSKIYPDISLLFNKPYYNPPVGGGLPADMQLLDAQLEKGFSVIVGVSFNHNPKEPVPTHFVEIYRKNSDGTYQCRDPWFESGDHNFNENYAVNGMNAPECILQMISYTGVLPTSAVATPSEAQKTADMASAIAQGSAMEVNKAVTPPPPLDTTTPRVDTTTDMTTPDVDATSETTITIPRDMYESLKREERAYQAMSAAGFSDIASIDNIRSDMLHQIQEVKVDSEKKLQDASIQHEQDHQTILDLEKEILNTNREAEMAASSTSELYGKRSTAIERTIALEQLVQKYKGELETMVSASAIPERERRSIASIVKYFANLRFAAEKMFTPADKTPQKTTGSVWASALGIKTLIAFLVIALPLSFIFVRQILAFIMH